MEEIQSTEILDREILDDARKKAARILKQADDATEAQNAEWEKKIEDCIADLDKKYLELEKQEFEKVMSCLPIDKLRLKIEKMESVLIAAEDNWYENLDREILLRLLEKEVKERLEFVSEGIENGLEPKVRWGIDKNELKVFIFKLTREEAEKIFNRLNIKCVIEEIHSTSRYPLIKIETPDALITASIQRIIDYFLHVKRTELFEALVGRGFMGNI